jgi:hypothetical protein
MFHWIVYGSRGNYDSETVTLHPGDLTGASYFLRVTD